MTDIVFIPGELITEADRESLTGAAYMMQAAYEHEKTWYDAIYKVKKEYPKISLWELECMWKAIDAYVDMNL